MAQTFSPITLGRSIRRLEAGGFVLTETRHPASLLLPVHSHEQANIALVLRGAFREMLEGRAYDCSPHGLVVKPAGAAHSDHYGVDGAHCLIIEVAPERLKEIQPFCSFLDCPSYLKGRAVSALVMQIYREFQTADAVTPLALEALTLELIALAARSARPTPASSEPRWLQKARNLLDLCFSRPPTLQQLADTANVHPAYLARAFRKYYGYTVGEYIRHRRLDFALDLLMSSEKPLLEVALEAGFYDQSHLTRAVKLHLRTTPARLRASRKKSI